MTDGQFDGVRIGGLMRCCLETLDGLYPDGPAKLASEGQRLQCRHARDAGHGWMVFRDGFWRWDPPATPPPITAKEDHHG